MSFKALIGIVSALVVAVGLAIIPAVASSEEPAGQQVPANEGSAESGSQPGQETAPPQPEAPAPQPQPDPGSDEGAEKPKSSAKKGRTSSSKSTVKIEKPEKKDRSDNDAGELDDSLLGEPLLITDELINGKEIPALPPLSMLPWLQEAAQRFAVPVEILMAIYWIESGFKPGLTSSAGAVGLMQFLRSTWQTQGLDFDKNGVSDPNTVDAFLGAANYLNNSDYRESVKEAIFAYNRSTEYVESVLKLARKYAEVAPLLNTTNTLVKALPPTLRDFSYEGATRDEAKVNAAAGSSVIAAASGVVEKIENVNGEARVVVRDFYNNVYSYRGLRLAEAVPQPKDKAIKKKRLARPEQESANSKARDSKQGSAAGSDSNKSKKKKKRAKAATKNATTTEQSPDERRRFSNPQRKNSSEYALRLGQIEEVLSEKKVKGFYRGHLSSKDIQLSEDDYDLVPLKPGTTVLAGTKIGEINGPLKFGVRPSGASRPFAHPERLFKLWKLLDKAGFRKVKSASPLLDPKRKQLDVDSVMYLAKKDKAALADLVLSDKRINIYEAGREDIKSGIISRFTLFSIGYLSVVGVVPTEITSLQRDGAITVNGTGSNHGFGRAVDITEFNGKSVIDDSQEFGNTWHAAKSLVELPAYWRPDEVITVHDLGGSSFADKAGHGDHAHAGFDSANRKVKKRTEKQTKGLNKWWRGVEKNMGKNSLPTDFDKLNKPSKWAIPAKGKAKTTSTK